MADFRDLKGKMTKFTNNQRQTGLISKTLLQESSSLKKIRTSRVWGVSGVPRFINKIPLWVLLIADCWLLNFKLLYLKTLKHKDPPNESQNTHLTKTEIFFPCLSSAFLCCIKGVTKQKQLIIWYNKHFYNSVVLYFCYFLLLCPFLLLFCYSFCYNYKQE